MISIITFDVEKECPTSHILNLTTELITIYNNF